jgi:hypothetical protein
MKDRRFAKWRTAWKVEGIIESNELGLCHQAELGIAPRSAAFRPSSPMASTASGQGSSCASCELKVAVEEDVLNKGPVSCLSSLRSCEMWSCLQKTQGFVICWALKVVI